MLRTAMFCNHCGSARDDSDRFCANCGSSLGVVPQAAAPSGPQIAPIGLRVLATFLDTAALWSIIVSLAAPVPRRMMQNGFANRWPAVLIPMGLCSIGLLYYVVLEAVFGATPGKAIAGIQVRLLDWRACDFRASMVRNLLRPVDAVAGYLLGMVVAILNESRQRVGDLMAGTIVVLQPTTARIRGIWAVTWFILASSAFVIIELFKSR